MVLHRPFELAALIGTLSPLMVSLQASSLHDHLYRLLSSPLGARNCANFEPPGPLAENCPFGRCFLSLIPLLNLLIGRPFLFVS